MVEKIRKVNRRNAWDEVRSKLNHSFKSLQLGKRMGLIETYIDKVSYDINIIDRNFEQRFVTNVGLSEVDLDQLIIPADKGYIWIDVASSILHGTIDEYVSNLQVTGVSNPIVTLYAGGSVQAIGIEFDNVSAMTTGEHALTITGTINRTIGDLEVGNVNLNLIIIKNMIGEMKLWGGSTAPTNYALCTGQLLAIASFPTLHGIIGNAYGGDGITTFSLPDFRGRLGIGAGSAPGLTPKAIGQKSGSETTSNTVSNSIAHIHDIEFLLSLSSAKNYH